MRNMYVTAGVVDADKLMHSADLIAKGMNNTTPEDVLVHWHPYSVIDKTTEPPTVKVAHCELLLIKNPVLLVEAANNTVIRHKYFPIVEETE